MTPEPITNPAAPFAGISGTFFFSRLVPGLITILLAIGAIYFFFTFLLGAIAWIGSGGDKAAVEHAKSKLSTAIIGLIIMLSVFAILILIETFFGISLLNLDLQYIRIFAPDPPLPGCDPINPFC